MAPVRAGAGCRLPRQDSGWVALSQGIRRDLERVVHAGYADEHGLVELIVLNIGLDLGVISPAFFAMLVMMAVVTTMMAPPLLPFLVYGQKNVQEQEAKEALESSELRD